MKNICKVINSNLLSTPYYKRCVLYSSQGIKFQTLLQNNGEIKVSNLASDQWRNQGFKGTSEMPLYKWRGTCNYACIPFKGTVKEK